MMFGEPESVLPGLQLVEYKDSPWLSAAGLGSWGPTVETLPWNIGREAATLQMEMQTLQIRGVDV